MTKLECRRNSQRGFGGKFRSLDSFVIQSLTRSSAFEEKLEGVQATCDTKSRR